MKDVRRNTDVRKRYYSSRWARLRLVVLARDRSLCQECARRGDTKLGNQIDHILPAEEHTELFWREDNLQTLCQVCHAKKTRRGE